MMRRSSRSLSDQSGFSLLELTVALAIIFILSGLATYAFVGISEQFRVRAAVQSIESIMKRARQNAISARSSRRMVLEMYRDPATDPALKQGDVPVRMWIERKRIQFLDWPNVPVDLDPDRLELVSDVSQLPEHMRVSDVTGVDAATLLPLVAPSMPGRVLLYFEFSSIGSARVYFNSVNGREEEMQDTISSVLPGAGRGVFLHVVRKNEVIEAIGDVSGTETVFYYTPSGRVPYFNDTSRALNLPSLLNLGGGTLLTDVTGNEPPASIYDEERVRVIRQMRNQVGTIYVIPQTGRTRAYEYGIGYPWSKREIQETS
jgi:prepilin-type N-terminal cleavage/methylation domain-containing protein